MFRPVEPCSTTYPAWSFLLLLLTAGDGEDVDVAAEVAELKKKMKE